MCKIPSKKITIYLPSLNGGGAERVFAILANEFIRLGFDVVLILGIAEGPYLEEISAKVEVVDFQSKRIRGSFLKLVKYFRKNRPNIVLTAMRHANIMVTIALILSNVKSRLILSERNSISISLKHMSTFKAIFLKFAMFATYRYADKIISVSKGVSDDLCSTLAINRSRVQVIYNPIETNSIINLSQEDVDLNWFSKISSPIVLSVGRLTKQKDHETLLYAFSKVIKRKKAHLVILGDGDLRDNLLKKIENLGLTDFVSLPGFILNPFPIMKKSDIFVLSSLWEGLPNSLIQAMTFGLPVVSTNCQFGPEEILENGRWGKLVPVGDINGLADAIIETLADGVHPDTACRSLDFSVEHASKLYLDAIFPS
jgi:glycosyltransferase involved in cell wall biosynthesis